MKIQCRDKKVGLKECHMQNGINSGQKSHEGAQLPLLKAPNEGPGNEPQRHNHRQSEGAKMMVRRKMISSGLTLPRLKTHCWKLGADTRLTESGATTLALPSQTTSIMKKPAITNQ